MRYLYQDSTELSVQRDFIQDLDNLLNVIKDAYPLEKAIISAKGDVGKSRREKDQRIARLKTFESDVKTQLNDMVSNNGTDEMEICRKSIIEGCISCVNQQTSRLESDFDAAIRDLTEKIDRDSKSACRIFEAFLEFGVYNTMCKHSLISEDGSGSALHGEFTAEVGKLSFNYELRFKGLVSVKQLTGLLHIPTWGKEGIFHKEDVLKMVNMSNHRLVGVEYVNAHIITTFKDKKGAEKVCIEMDRDTNEYSISYGTEDPIDITKDGSLSKEIDDANVLGLMHAVIDYVGDAENRAVSTLKTVTFDGADAIKDSMIFYALKVILTEYGKLASECVAHGVTKDELIIKIESDDGTRTEKYMPISTIESCFAQFGSEGAELADAFGLGALKG